MNSPLLILLFGLNLICINLKKSSGIIFFDTDDLICNRLINITEIQMRAL